MNALYASLLMISSFSSLLTLIVITRRLNNTGAKFFAILMFANAIWAATYSVFWLTSDPFSKYFWLNMTYFGVVIVPGAFFLFSLHYMRHDLKLSFTKVALFAVEPILTLVLVWTDPLHGWFFAGKREPTTSTIFAGSWYFWFHVIYSYGFLLISTIILTLSTLRIKTFYRWQSFLVIAGLIFPWVMNILSLVKLTPWPDLDPTPIAFTLTGVFILYSLLEWRFLDIAPIGRELLIEHMKDGVIILDKQNRIVDFNPAGLSMIGNDQLKIGTSAEQYFKEWPSDVLSILNPGVEELEIRLSCQPDVYLDMQNLPIYDKNKHFLGKILTWHDITSKKNAELALVQTNNLLKARVDEIEILQHKLKEQVIRDELTGAYNRYYLNETIEREIERARRDKIPLALMMIDIDSFKYINDTFGHQTGDQVLREVSGLMAKHIRSSDILCRYGGDEFVMIMPGSNLITAFNRAEILRKRLETLEFNKTFHISISGGISLFPENAKTQQDLFRAADNALYIAKSSGRNRIVIAS